jgi:predicted P-loop ATPase
MQVHNNPTFQWARYYAMKLSVIPVLLHYVTRYDAVWDPDINGYKNSPVCSCSQGARCQNPGKHPIVGWKQRDLSTPEKALQVCAELLQQDPRYGLALRTGPESGIAVIDVDVKPDKRGDLALYDALSRLGVDSEEMLTLQQITGSGGFHLVFRYPFNRRIPTVTNHPAFGPGVDIKGEGGIFNVAPSIHKNGNPYYWRDTASPIPEQILELPPQILHVVEKVSDLDPLRARLNDQLEAYTPNVEDLKDLSQRLRMQRKNPRMKEVGRALEKAVDGEAVFLDGGAHDGYRDMAFVIAREWPLFDVEIVLEMLRPSLEARSRVRPEASTDLHNLRDSLETARRKAEEFRSSWAAMLKRDANSELVACVSNYKTICENDPEVKDAIAYDTRFKTLYLKKQINGLPAPFPRTLSEEDRVMLAAFFERKYGFIVSNRKDLMDTFEASAKMLGSIDPLAEWVRSHEGVWDGIPRLETLMQRVAGTPDSAWVRRVFPMWFKGFVQRVLFPGSKNDTMLILEGPQGVGKSTFFKALLPESRYFSDSLHKLSQDENVFRALHAGPAIFEISELASFSKSTLAELKAFLSASSDLVRPLYKTAYHASRNFIVVGTTNDRQYLQDPTGARRFLPINVTSSINLEQLYAERSQLYAEALHGLARGDITYLTLDEVAYHSEITDARQEVDPWADVVIHYLTQHKNEHVSINAILRDAFDFDLKHVTRREHIRVANILRSMGWESWKSHGNMKWRQIADHEVI